MNHTDARAVLRTMQFALEAHGDQKRKYSGAPYIVHPVAVASLVTEYGGSLHMICAALLHDVVEDTDVSHQDLMSTFGSDVAHMVYDLTEQWCDGNRAYRKSREAVRLGRCSANSQTIKVCDLIDNTKDIVKFDPKFAVVYLEEKGELLKALTLADPRLRDMAWEQLFDAQVQLKKGDE